MNPSDHEVEPAVDAGLDQLKLGGNRVEIGLNVGGGHGQSEILGHGLVHRRFFGRIKIIGRHPGIDRSDNRPA